LIRGQGEQAFSRKGLTAEIEHLIQECEEECWTIVTGFWQLRREKNGVGQRKEIKVAKNQPKYKGKYLGTVRLEYSPKGNFGI